MGNISLTLMKYNKARLEDELLPEEPDTVVRDAKLYLGKCSMNGGSYNYANTRGLSHWFLAAEFDDCWVTMEARNVRGKLTPCYKKSVTRPRGSLRPMNEVSAVDEYKFLTSADFSYSILALFQGLLGSQKFHVRASPRQLREITAEHLDNNDCYSLANNNCHTWTLRTATQLYKVLDK